MPETKQETYDVTKLSEVEIKELCHNLATLECLAFKTDMQQEYDYFFKKMMDKSYFFSRVLLCKDKEKIVGYYFCYVRKVPISSDKKCIVVTGDIMLLPEYRKNNFFIVAATIVAKEFFMKYPCMPHKIFIFNECLNPISYDAICKYVPKVYPRPGSEASEELIQTYNSILEINNIKLVAPWKNGGHLTSVELTDQKKKELQNSNSPYIKFFLEINPDYWKGYSIPVICEGGWYAFSYTMGVYLTKYLQKTYRNNFFNNTFKSNQKANDNKDTVDNVDNSVSLKTPLSKL